MRDPGLEAKAAADLRHSQGIVLDITDRKRAEAERQQLTAMLQATREGAAVSRETSASGTGSPGPDLLAGRS